MGDIRGQDLQDDWIPHGFRGLDGSLGRGGGYRPGRGDAVGLEQRLRVLLGQYVARPCRKRVKTLAQSPAVKGKLDRDVFGSLVEDLQVAGIADQGHEGPDALLGSGISGNSGIVEDAQPFLHAGGAQPGSQNGLGRRRRQGADLLGDRRGIGHRLGGDDDQEGVDPAVVQYNRRGLGR